MGNFSLTAAAFLGVMSDGLLVKRSMTIAGKRTSVALEAQFWDQLDALAKQRRTTLPHLFAMIDSQRAPDASFASAARVFALLHRIEPVSAILG